jgi:uncharacterized protein (TIGR03437 family)
MRAFTLMLLAAAMASPQGVWERKADYPISATEVSAAAIGGKIYALCGIMAGASVSNLFIYDPRTDSWSEGAPAPLPGGADHCNVASAAGKLYLLGAIRIGTSFIDGDTHEYDPATNRWQTVARMNVPRGASGVATIGPRIYVAGGLAANGTVADFEVFDTETRQWTRLPNMPTARDHLTAQAAAGRFYALLGRAGADFNINEEYDPAANSWRRRASAPTARGGLGSGTIGGRIQVVGGEGNSGTPLGTFQQNEEYDPVTDTWRTLAPMPTPRHGLYGVTIDERLFTPSGGPRAGGFFSSVHEAFYLPPPQPPRITGAATTAPGALLSLFGERLSHGEQIATRLPLAVQMNAVRAAIANQPAPLLFVSPGQINLEVPSSLAPGTHPLTVWHAGSESQPFNLTVASVAPQIFSLSQDGTGQGAILIASTGIIAGPQGRPARPGEIIEIYCTGLGASAQPVEVLIGGLQASVLFSGAAPGFAGLNQVNARVPAVQPALSVPVRITIAGAPSNTVTIAVQPSEAPCHVPGCALLP